MHIGNGRIIEQIPELLFPLDQRLVGLLESPGHLVL